MINYKFLFFGIIISILPDIFNLNQELDHNSKIALRMMILMIFFWLTETLPNSITAFLPIIFSPFFVDISLKEIVAPYSSTVVFLLLGGFLLANGFEESNLHKRIALKTITNFGKSKRMY